MIANNLSSLPGFYLTDSVSSPRRSCSEGSLSTFAGSKTVNVSIKSQEESDSERTSLEKIYKKSLGLKLADTMSRVCNLTGYAFIIASKTQCIQKVVAVSSGLLAASTGFFLAATVCSVFSNTKSYLKAQSEYKKANVQGDLLLEEIAQKRIRSKKWQVVGDMFCIGAHTASFAAPFSPPALLTSLVVVGCLSSFVGKQFDARERFPLGKVMRNWNFWTNCLSGGAKPLKNSILSPVFA